MALHELLKNPDFCAMMHGVYRLHRLDKAGRLDSPEADAIRDATDAPWRRLSPTERRAVGTLSEALYVWEEAMNDNRELSEMGKALDAEGLDATPPPAPAGVQVIELKLTGGVLVEGLSRDAVIAALVAATRCPVVVRGEDDMPEDVVTLFMKMAEKLPQLTLNEHQDACRTTAIYPDQDRCLLYPLLGMVNELGEVIGAVENSIDDLPDDTPACAVKLLLGAATYVGEVAGVFKKAYRNRGGVLTGEDIAPIREMLEFTQECLGRMVHKVEHFRRIELPEMALVDAQRDKLGREMGDCHWYWNQALTEAGLRAEDVARETEAKLQARMAAGTIRSSGDDEATRPKEPS